MKLIRSTLKLINIILIVVFCMNLTTGAEQTTPKEPEYVELLDGEDTYKAIVYDGTNIIHLSEFSFTGNTKIGGIKKTNDDSTNTLSLATIRIIEILKDDYVSPKYQDKEYILATLTSVNGIKTTGLLIPRNIVICGIEEGSNIKKAWYLRKVNKIRIKHSKILPPKLTENEDEDGIFDKIKSGIKKATNAIDPEN